MEQDATAATVTAGCVAVDAAPAAVVGVVGAAAAGPVALVTGELKFAATLWSTFPLASVIAPVSVPIATSVPPLFANCVMVAVPWNVPPLSGPEAVLPVTVPPTGTASGV